MNPFTYDVFSVGVKVDAKAVLGIEGYVTINVNSKAIREGDFKNLDVSLSVDGSGSAGISLEGAGLLRIGGSDGTVKDQSRLDIIGTDGVPLNLGACAELCFNGSATFDGNAKNGIARSVSYGIGSALGGAGIDIGIDILQLSDYGLYGINDGDGSKEFRLPFFNPEYKDKVIRKLAPLNDPENPIKLK